MYFSQAAVDIRGLPKLEGTVHVNIALIVKFMPNFFFAPGEYPPVATQSQPTNDDFLFHQGGAKGLGQIQFHDYREAFEGADLPNVTRFAEQAEIFRELLSSDPPGPDQMKDIAFLLAGGEIFALVVYAQLILENARIYEITDDLLDQIFDFMVRDMAKFALQLFTQPSSTAKQMACCQRMIQKAVHDPKRYGRVWEDEVAPLSGAYEMRR
jgi:acyl-CoA dehydrogenase